MRSRLAAIALSVLAVLGLAVPLVSASAPPLKVVIIVGATGSTTATYRASADTAAAEAAQALPGATVIRIYSPNATWDAVRPALQGANFVVYLGHGNGFPSPYRSSLWSYSQDGFGLNDPANPSDSVTSYYGEWYIANQVRLAPNAVVILSHLCYASGNSEPQFAAPTLAVAQQRIDNYAAGFIAAGARAVIAESFWDPGTYFGLLSQPGQSVEQIWRTMSYAHGGATPFPSVRDPGFTAYYDPDTSPGIYHRSLVVLPGLSTSAIAANASGSTDRIAGSDRYATAAAISAATYDPGVPVAYIATGLGFPDALAGAAGAGHTGGPVLLVAPTSVPSSTAAELARLKPARIIILGGTAAVSDSVAGALAAYTAGGVGRLAGQDRYSTAAAISAATFGPGVPVAYIATGLNFPDALSGAAAAGTTGGPILLVPGGSVPDVTAAELTRLKPGRIVILGGTSVISDAVAAALVPFTPGGVTRLAGGDRYATSAAISAATFAAGVPIAYVATGLNFPDALTGAAAAGKTGGPVLLVPGTSIPSSTAAELARLRPARVVVLGSAGVVSDGVLTSLAPYIP